MRIGGEKPGAEFRGSLKMSNNLFDQLREAAKRKAQELDEKFDLKNKVGQGIDAASKVANDAARSVQEQFNKVDEQFGVTDNLRETAAKAEEKIRQGSEAAQTGAEKASQAAEETFNQVFGSAQTYYRRAEQAYNFGSHSSRLAEAAVSGYESARVWVRENPGKTAVVTL